MVCFFYYRLQENYTLLQARLQETVDCKKRLEVDLKQQTQTNRALIADMNALKPEIKRLYKIREQYKK